MIKNVFGRKFKRDTNERKALFKGLISSLILDEKIQTTLEKAKAIKGDVDKIVNKAKKENNMARYLLQPYLSSDTMQKIIIDIAPRFNDRNSGYTRINRLGRRFSDNAQMVLMEWVVGPKLKVLTTTPTKSKSVKEGKEPVKKTKEVNKEKKEVKRSTKKK